MEITSRDNLTFKNLLKLTKKKYRDKLGLCIIEGEKFVTERVGLARSVFVRKSHSSRYSFTNTCVLNDNLFDEVGTLEATQGVMAIVSVPRPQALTFPFLVLDNIQDPGNMGTLLRTAAAFGFKTVFCITCVDVWSQKVIRAGVGSQFSLNIVDINVENFKSFILNEMKGAELLIADKGSDEFNFANCMGRFGLVLGNEGRGISPALKLLPHTVITISMNSCVESLNVAIAGAILMYEAHKKLK